MSAGESAVLRSVKPHVGKENTMLPPLTSPNRVLSIAKNPKFSSNPKSAMIRRPNGDGETKGARVAPPMSSSPAESAAAAPADQRRILELERSMRFMKEHHEKILLKLYDEIEELKQKNRQLNFRVVMSPSTLPAHLLSPEEDQPQGSPRESPRHRPGSAARSPARQRTANEASAGHPGGATVQLELLESELAELRRSLEAERTRSQKLSDQLHTASQTSGGSAIYRPPPGIIADLESRLAAAENHARQLKRERDDAQKELARMRNSIQFRPPWRAGGQAPGRQQQPQKQPQQPAPPPRHRSPPHKPAAAAGQPPPQQQQQQQLPRLPQHAAKHATQHRSDAARVGTAASAPVRTPESRPPSHGSLPALPRGRGATAGSAPRAPPTGAPPPPPPPRASKR